MNLDQFWSIIDKGKDSPALVRIVADELRKLQADEIVSYQEHFDAMFERAFRWDLWGAAYIIEGGYSEYGFIYFRYWLISKGREIYEKALANPDSLVDLVTGDDEAVDIGNELFGYLAMEVYADQTGCQMTRKHSVAMGPPEGEDWDFDDQAENFRRLPKLSKKFTEIYGFPNPVSPTASPST